MKAKKPGREKLSFKVDREEIEINSDWVNAVMGPTPAAGGVFLGPNANNATVENPAPVENSAPGTELTTVEQPATVEANVNAGDCKPDISDDNATVELCATDEIYTTGDHCAPVENTATVATPSTRKVRPKPIRRITDGLTPGQYAVYSLMFQYGGASPGSESRLYRGGYADLCALTGLSKRGVQNIVAELQQKRVISVHQPPGYHRTQTSVYRIPPQEAVVDGWLSRGLRFACGKSKTLTATVAFSATG